MDDTYKPIDFRTVVLNLTFKIDIVTTRPVMDVMRSKMTLSIFKKVSPKGMIWKAKPIRVSNRQVKSAFLNVMSSIRNSLPNPHQMTGVTIKPDIINRIRTNISKSIFLPYNVCGTPVCQTDSILTLNFTKTA